MKVEALLAIFGMAVVTYGCRFAGFWLMNHSRSLNGLEKVLKYTPGSIIAAVIAPVALLNGFDDAIAATVVALVMIRSQNLLLSICLGVATVLMVRYFL
jgi:branched chain amino acid efflux pump